MFIFPPIQKNLNKWAWACDLFSAAQLDVLEHEAASADMEAKVGDSRQEVEKSIRRSKIKWADPTDPKHRWWVSELGNVISDMNADHFHFSLTGFCENAQFTRYEAEDEGEYCWHQDYGNGVSRKLSMAMQLTEPSSYEGGDFELFLGREPFKVERKRGMMAFFPSFQLHRVTQVTKGARHSLVVWVSGEPFR